MRAFQRLCLAAAMALSALPPARAWMSADGAMNLSIGAGHYLLNEEVQRAARAGRSGGGAGAGAAPKATWTNVRFTRTSDTAGLNMLVGFYPPAQHAQMRQGFLALHSSYPQVARQLGVPTDDVATGMASFLAGAYMAYNNQNLSNSDVKPLAHQFRSALAHQKDFARVSNAEKQRMYDVMVMLGMLMATTQVQLQRQPNPALEGPMRQLGKQMIEGFLKVDANRLRITSSGMQIV